jgi:hypothetical protein
MIDLKLPPKGFTKAEREWIENVLIPAIRTARVIDGRNIHSREENNQGTLINASDCPPCS